MDFYQVKALHISFLNFQMSIYITANKILIFLKKAFFHNFPEITRRWKSGKEFTTSYVEGFSILYNFAIET